MDVMCRVLLPVTSHATPCWPVTQRPAQHRCLPPLGRPAPGALGPSSPARSCVTPRRSRRQSRNLHANASSASRATGQAEEWLRIDTDQQTAADMRALLDEGDASTISSLMDSRLEFGTAGLRGLMGPGYSRMNQVTVQQTTQGLCRYLQAQCPESLSTGGVVIGYDGRHGSERFSRIAAAVLMSQGIHVHLFSALVPTPFVAFAVELLGCGGGVMVTASHNPKEYNGYKVYWGNGCQIIPPHDAGIAQAILDNLELWDISHLLDGDLPLLSDPLEKVSGAYYSSLHSALHTDVHIPQGFRAAYTPLHGVGGRWLQRAFHEFGLPEPDAEFPTVTFPNPEEGEGTWSLTFAAAEAAGLQLAFANDPDADRFAVAEHSASGGWRTFTGNEIGILLADWALNVFKRKNPGFPMDKVAMLTTVVSSEMMGAMAAKEGFRFEQTLTGFKWLGNVAKDLEAEGYRVVFAFEEAIGFMFGTLEKDKDGISAAVAFAQMAADLSGRGATISEHLEQLKGRYGTFVGRQGYFIAREPSQSEAVFDRLRAHGRYPQVLAGREILSVRDLGVGLDTSQPGGRATLPWTAGDLSITFTIEGGATLTLRASGTEPKLKYYLEVAGEDEQQLTQTATEIEEAITEELVRPSESGLAVRQ